MSDITIPWQSLSEDALQGIVEEFVTREGTDYGAEVSFETKCRQVVGQIKAGTAIITYSESEQTCSIIPLQGP